MHPLGPTSAEVDTPAKVFSIATGREIGREMSRLAGRPEDWITRKELARRVGVHPKTIYRRQHDPEMPLPYVKQWNRNGPVRYHWPTVQAWFVARCEAGMIPW